MLFCGCEACGVHILHHIHQRRARLLLLACVRVDLQQQHTHITVAQTQRSESGIAGCGVCVYVSPVRLGSHTFPAFAVSSIHVS